MTAGRRWADPSLQLSHPTEQQGARTAAAFAVFIKSAFPGVQVGKLPVSGQTTPTMTIPASTGATETPTEIKPNIIQKLPTGTDINLVSHNRPGNNYEPFIKDSKWVQSVGSGLSYKAYSNDYTDASYAASRAGGCLRSVSATRGSSYSSMRR